MAKVCREHFEHITPGSIPFSFLFSFTWREDNGARGIINGRTSAGG